jgi:SPP1 family predicted phage head-tail adaptor
MSHRLILERELRADDGGGGATVTWETVTEMWGAIEMPSGTERVRAGGIEGEVNAVITIRYRDDVAPAMRFTAGGLVFEILSALDVDGRRRYLRCQCQRRGL